MKLVSTAEMQQVEREADAHGLSYEMMMEHAGSGLAQAVIERYGEFRDGGVLGLVGSGNNGGDTLVALAIMADRGWSASAYIVRPRAEDDPLVERLKSSGGTILDGSQDAKQKQLKTAVEEHAVLMDGILGTGISLPLRGSAKDVLATVKKALSNQESRPRIVAVDCPSGVDCDSGAAADECLPADLTVTMAAVKKGLLSFPANDQVGDLQLVGIGLKRNDKRSPTWQSLKRSVLSGEIIREMLPVRARDAHKGTFGTALVISGSINYTGAALLAGKAAYRVGTGLVTMGVPSLLHSALAGEFPEGTWLLLPHEMGVIDDTAAEIVRENLGNSSAILLGPGFGMEDTTKNFIRKLFSNQQMTKKARIGFVLSADAEPTADPSALPPAVVDADGLKLLSQIEGWHELIDQPAILTPHPGEMSVMTGIDVKEIQSDRIGVAEKYAQEWGHVVVLKGAHTVIADPGGNTALLPVADPSLARAGSGDVLAGAITGLRAQGLGAFEAAACGCWIHAHSGLFAAQMLGTSSSVIAGDLINAIPDVFHSLDR